MARSLWLVAALAAVLSAFLWAQTPVSPKPPFTAKDAERGLPLVTKAFEIRQQIGDFRAPAEPFKIAGNLYFVGVANGENYLLTSPQGHILFGAGFANTGELVAKNIEALGFKLTDIKAILLNHYHGDQSGAAAFFKEKTGAAVMAGIAEVPYLEHGGTLPTGTPIANVSAAPAAPAAELSPFGIYPSPQFQNINNYQPVHIDRALSDGDVIKVGPSTVTAYLAPGHSPSSTSWLYSVREGNRDYRVFEFCCWEYPDDFSHSSYITEAGVHHTFETFAKVLPVDIYLETGSYGWSGMLNQASGTWAERLAKLRTDSKLWVNRQIFPALSAAREVWFEQTLAKLKNTSAASK